MVSIQQAVSAVAIDISSQANQIQVIAADESRRFRSQQLDIPCPLIILYSNCYLNLDSLSSPYVNKRVLFARDGYCCQYCGVSKSSSKLTVDHIQPSHLFASRSEATNWDNVTTACQSCNQAKGGKLVDEYGKAPLNPPQQPNYIQMRFAGLVNDIQRDYINIYFRGDYVL